MSARRDRLVWLLVGAVAVLAVAVVALVGVLLVRDDGGDEPAAPTTTPGSTAPTSTPPGSTPIGPTTTTSTPEGDVGIQDVTVQQGIIQRQYLVLTPAEVPTTQRLPVVMVLHGLGYDRWAMSKAADWAGAVARDHFVAVFPQGVLNSWNAGPCCPPASLGNVDDVGFLDQVVAQLRGRSDVDPDRLYLAGFSNGGIMVYAEACARSDVFAAVAPMAGTNLMGCAPSRPVSLLHLHGDPDPVVPYDGQLTVSQLLASADFPPVQDSVAAWAAADGCDPEPDSTREAGVRRQTWRGCRDSKVELITYPGNGHTWPAGPVDGIDELLRFFDIRR